MNSSTNLLAAVMQMSDGDRFEFAMSILDQVSPAGMSQDEILDEALRRQDEIESGKVATLSFDELVLGLTHRPQSLAR